MVGTNVKAETTSLMDKRSALESEMNSIIARLSQPGAPGLSGNLVDSEGFPRSDIDVPLVRAERRRLAGEKRCEMQKREAGVKVGKGCGCDCYGFLKGEDD
ncbi:hypothetical protein TSUD_280530 [Trifolium subterraneum]|uniref:Nas2 N-terminal domain-containing protein n=1 Tax=Trifolium subterraneum TaxID=3900 RepID=A0A2Z6NUM0_TRISU|nr:hypothetical protein TSUD_280530 [Trifolium subterraneum]